MKVTQPKFNLLDAFRGLSREKWALGATILTGKMIGLGLVVAAMFTIPGLLPSAAHAAAAPAKPTDLETSMINSINTASPTQPGSASVRDFMTASTCVPCVWSSCMKNRTSMFVSSPITKLSHSQRWSVCR